MIKGYRARPRRSTKAERYASRQNNALAALGPYGMTVEYLAQCARLEKALRKWGELECGTAHGGVEYEDVDDGELKPYCTFYHPTTGARSKFKNQWPVLMRRLERLRTDMPSITFYVQGDPRGASLYALRPGDVPAGEEASSWYTRGICLCLED
jgi:hypothetical protein